MKPSKMRPLLNAIWPDSHLECSNMNNQTSYPEIEKAIRNARMDLMLDHPFFGCIALRLVIKCDTDKTDTCATDGRHLFYAPEFMSKLERAQLVGLLAHEAMHIACQHTLRRDNRDPEWWNIAADYAINGILASEGFTLPPDGCVDAQYSGMSAERIYPLIYQPMPQTSCPPGMLR